MSNPYETAKQKKHSVLGPTLKFKGELSAEEDLLIQAKIEGSIKHSSNLTIGEEGQVKADIEAEHIAIEGKVKGDLSGSTSVVIRDTADIDGNIYSPVVTLLEGATFNGSIDMSGKTAADAANDAAEKETREQERAAAKESKSVGGQSSSAAAKKKPSRPEKKPASAA